MKLVRRMAVAGGVVCFSMIMWAGDAFGLDPCSLLTPQQVASALDVQGIPTGALSLDIALGGRGLPRGRIIEIFGPESSGKTTVTLHAVANAQRQGGVAAFIDAEPPLDHEAADYREP